ncbi:MAG: sugar phosphate nucleotidyltransferase, partial [Chloroflexota bacterium]|nr:sugar phosphate nucleotidyltransferase [Chloroflexota bacterium]
MERIQQAVILAAGEGERLRPFTGLKPKVMIAIANKPVLRHVVEALAKNGISRVVVVVGYRKEQVLDFLGSGEAYGVEVSNAIQKQQLGTAHALKQAREMVGDRFLVLSGDNIIGPATLADFVCASPQALLTVEQENFSKYGAVSVKGDRVVDIVEKPEAAQTNLVSTGIYALSREVFPFLEDEVDLPTALRNMMASGYPVTAHRTKGTWMDVVYPWDILRLNDAALRGLSASLAGTTERGVVIKGNVVVGRGTHILPNTYIQGPAIIGENCEIGPSACILPATSLGDYVIVSAFTQVENSVLGSQVQIGPGAFIKDSVIDRGCL